MIESGAAMLATRRLNKLAPIVCIVLLTSAYAPSHAAPSDTPLPPGVAVSVATAKRACFTDTVELVGSIVPRNEVLVRPDNEGSQLSAISVEAGDTVRSGQVLAKLSSPNNKQHLEVDAPSAGLVLAAPTVIGEPVSPRGEPLFRIAAGGDLDLSAEVPATDASRLEAGQSAKVNFAGLDNVQGSVRLVSSMVDPGTQLGNVRISLQPNSQLRVGAFGRAMVNVANRCGISIPLSALLFDPDGAVVQVIHDNRVEARRVTVGLYGLDKVEIRDGLSAGDVVVQRAGAFLREGDRVRPIDQAE